MYEKILQRSDGKCLVVIDKQLVYLTPRTALDKRIDKLADLICEHYGLADLGDPSDTTGVSR
jgi:hypothetical protein